MVVKLDTSDAFVLLIKYDTYNMQQTLEQCDQAEAQNIPMYLIAKGGTNIQPLLSYPWRQGMIFTYNHDTELVKIMNKIRQDLKYIKAVGV